MEKCKHLNLEYSQRRIIAEVDIIDYIALVQKKSNEINQENPLVYGNKIRNGYVWKFEKIKKLK